jgi:murein DD-endopeptidase MepM/ murein hydrolase activator NlpD
MQALDVVAGQTVHAGDPLGQVGQEGNATGCHLHFEVHPTGGTIYEDDTDPAAWLAQVDAYPGAS